MKIRLLQRKTNALIVSVKQNLYMKIGLIKSKKKKKKSFDCITSSGGLVEE